MPAALLEVAGRLDARVDVHVDVRKAELAVREGRDRDERYVLRLVLHERCEAVLADVDRVVAQELVDGAVVGAGRDLEVEAFYLDGAVEDGRVDVVLGQPDPQLLIRHGFSSHQPGRAAASGTNMLSTVRRAGVTPCS